MRLAYFKLKQKARLFLSVFSINRIGPHHPIGRHIRLFGGSIWTPEGTNGDFRQWEYNGAGQIRNVQTLEFHKTGEKWSSQVIAYMADQKGAIQICPTCRDHVMTLKIVCPRVEIEPGAPSWARLLFWYWRKTGRIA